MESPKTDNDLRMLEIGASIRMRPRLYFENCFTEKALDSMVFEVLCHAIDEYFDGMCKNITIQVQEDYFVMNYDAGMSLKIKHKDDGLTNAELIMTEILACRNERKHLSVGEEFCNLGLATINYAAERCELVTVCQGEKGSFVFEDGNTISKEIGPADTNQDSTQIMMMPNKQIFEGLGFTIEGIHKRAKEISGKLPGLNIRILPE